MTKGMNSHARLLDHYNHHLQIVIDDFTRASCAHNGERYVVSDFLHLREFMPGVGVRINLSKNILFIGRRLS